MSNKLKKIWIGSFQDGEIVVYDHRLQDRRDNQRVILWSRQSGRLDRYFKDVAKPNLKGLSDMKLAKKVISEYEQFISNEVQARHKEFLRKIGRPFIGVRFADDSKHRTAHCYHCKNELDNSVDLECMKCGWILCFYCGACGCSFRQF